jgi:hypothetical protein
MHTTAAVHRLARWWFYLATVALALSVWILQDYVYHKIFSTPGVVFSESSTTPVPPDDWQKMSVQAMAQTNGLLTTLGTALLGAVGLLISNQASDRSRPRHRWAAFLAIACGGLSLFFGYTNHSNLLYMIQYKNINPYDPGYLYSSHAQFYTLLAGAFFAADFAVHYLGKETEQGGLT